MMDAENGLRFSRRVRTERLIAVGRLVLLVVAFVAAAASPGWQGELQVPIGILAGGIVYALIAALLSWAPDASGRRTSAVLHAVDILLFSVLVVTYGSSSPFFLYYLFVLLAATLRWHARGAIRTGLAVGLVYLAAGALDQSAAGFTAAEGFRFGLRLGSLAVATILLAYLGREQQRLQVDLARLSSWPDAPMEDEALFLRQMLLHVCRLHDARRAVLVREEGEEPWVRIDDCGAEGCDTTREPVPRAEGLVAQPLAGVIFFCDDLHRPVGRVVYRSPVGLQRWRGDPVMSPVRDRLRARTLVSCPLTSQAVSGRLFVLDGRRGSDDELVLAEIVTGMLSARLDQRALARRTRDRAILEERGRFSRDLHDGLLQSLTAWGLQIGDIARRVQGSDATVAERLEEMRRQMSVDQRELRTFIGRLASDVPAEPVDFSLIGRLHDLRDRFADEWGLTVEVDFSGLHALVPSALRAEICRLVHEGLANAARHAQTSLARVVVAATDEDVFLSIQDRGCGFSFHGRFNLARLRADRRGPTSVMDRVSALGGELVLDSSPSGSRIDIVLPFESRSRERGQNAS